MTSNFPWNILTSDLINLKIKNKIKAGPEIAGKCLMGLCRHSCRQQLPSCCFQTEASTSHHDAEWWVISCKMMSPFYFTKSSEVSVTAHHIQDGPNRHDNPSFRHRTTLPVEVMLSILQISKHVRGNFCTLSIHLILHECQIMQKIKMVKKKKRKKKKVLGHFLWQ